MADLHFELVTPEKLIRSEDVHMVVVPGTEGDFGVMAGHAPVMTTLKDSEVKIYKTAGAQPESVKVSGGFAEVGDKGLTILAEQAFPLGEVDAALLAQEVRNAEEDVPDAKDGATKDAAELKLQQLREVQSALGHSASGH